MRSFRPSFDALALVILLPLAGLLGVVVGVMCVALAFGGNTGCVSETVVPTNASRGIQGVPSNLIPIYQHAAARYSLGPKGPAMLASINFNETTFGTNMNNTTGSGAEGWMMFMPATWASYGVDADGDGNRDPFNPWDAIFAAARYLRASGAPGDWHAAILAYNHAEWYVERIMGDFTTFEHASLLGIESEAGGVACGPSVGASAALRGVERLTSPRAFKALPAKLWVGGGTPESVDARIWPDAIWLLETFHLRVTAARESGHNTHGDGTAMDMVPAPGYGWERTAEAVARTLGWIPSCGTSGSYPVCPLVPAIQFVGYNGYPDHGDPLHAGSNAHLHVSWKSSSFGSAGLSPPPAWVEAFPLTG